MSYEKFDREEIVFEMGTEGQKFYVILKGSVGVLVPIPKIIEEVNEKGEVTTRTDFVMTDVKTLNTGAAFGELALMDKKPRAATIICKSDCYFAVLEKSAFNNILSKICQNIAV